MNECGRALHLSIAADMLDVKRVQRMLHGACVLVVRTDQILKTLKHARLDNSYEAEFD